MGTRLKPCPSSKVSPHLKNVPQGLKPSLASPGTARLKSCPDTEHQSSGYRKHAHFRRSGSIDIFENSSHARPIGLRRFMCCPSWTTEKSNWDYARKSRHAFISSTTCNYSKRAPCAGGSSLSRKLLKPTPTRRKRCCKVKWTRSRNPRAMVASSS
jgi:hypothetical protein